jgi:hypothetical protein
MSRAWQAERQADREEELLSRDLADGRITRAEYNTEMRNLQREIRYAYEADREEALRRVDDDWGVY